MTTTKSTTGRRARRVLGVIGSVVGATVTFVSATAAAAIVHLDLPATRRLVATQVNSILRDTLMGEVRIENIGHLGLRGVDGVHVRVKDPSGVEVLRVRNIRVRVNGIDAARSALFGKGPITINVPSASIADADANLDADETGQSLRMANAFTPKPKPPEPPSPPGRGVHVEAPRFELAHGHAHGTPPNATKIDARLDELAAHAHITPQLVRADLDRVTLTTNGLPRNVDPAGSVHGYFALPAPNGNGFDLHARFDGKVGGMPTTAEAHIDDQRIDARVDTYDRTGQSARDMVSEVQLTEPLSIHAEAHGVLSHFDTNAKVRIGGASVDAKASIDTTDTAKTRIEGEVTARHVDLSAITTDAPESDLGLDATGSVALAKDGGIDGEASIDTLPGRLDRDEIPKVEIRSSFTKQTAHVRARIYERSMPTEVALDMTPREGIAEGRAIDASVRTKIPDIRRLPKVGSTIGVGGSARAIASGRLLLPEKAITADAEATLSQTTMPKIGDLAIAETTAKASVKGTIDQPVIDGEVHAKNILVNKMLFTSITAAASVTTGARVGGEAPIGAKITIRDARVDATRLANEPIQASARVVRIEGPSLSVEGAEVLGLGDPIHADMSKTPRAIHAKVDAPRIDLATVMKLADQTKLVSAGTLAIRGEGTLESNGDARGDVHASVEGLEAQLVHKGRAKVEASLDGRELALDANAELDTTGHVRVYTKKVVLGGPATNPKSWTRAHGRVQVDSELDLQRVASLIPSEKLPVSEIHGTLTMQGRFGRDGEDAPPEVQFHAHTNGLVFAGKNAVGASQVGQLRVEEPSPWRSTNLDLGVDVRNDGTSGLTSLAFRVTDASGALVAVDAKAILPAKEIADDPSKARDKVLSAPLAAKIVIPPRRLDRLPNILGVKDLQGAIEADLDAWGTALEPRAHLALRGRGVRSPTMPRGLKADSDVTVDYDGDALDLNAKVQSDGKEVLVATSRVEARSRDLIAPPPGSENKALAWNASARVHVEDFPLQTIPQVADRRVRGRVTGDVTLDGLHEDARVHAKIDLAKLAVGKARYEKGKIVVDAGGGKLAAKVRVDQKDGYLDASMATGMQWGAALAPSLDANEPVQARLVAKAFRAAAIQPFVESAVPALDGRIDADAEASLVPGKPGAQIQGKVTFREGTVQIAALGDELQDVRATATLSPDGTIKVTDVFAKGTQGELRAHADAKLDGTRLADANATIEIPERRALSISAQGTPLGEVSGTVTVKASQSANGKNTKLAVDVPKLLVELPHSTKSSVQQLSEKENIRVGVYKDERTFVKVPLDYEDTVPPEKKQEEEASRLEVAVHLGRIEVQRGNSARLAVTGDTNVVVGADTRVTGQIQTLQGGWVDVQGKKFDIEKGTITFNGETPPNPVVVVTAGWTAADGSRIYADFVGPVKTGKVTLRSEPPRPKNEILALVLFGTADGANPTPPPAGRAPDGTTKAAVGLGGGFAAQGLTEALDDLAGIQATARIDTTSSNNPRPEVQIQLTPRITVGFAHVLGTPPITEPDKNFAKGGWRFHKNWSLETTIGDRGTGIVDGIWTKRY